MRNFSLNEKSPVPLYYQIKEVILEKIKNGQWKEDQKVPSERELMGEFNVSRATVRQALNELTQEGYIKKKQGKGTFVSKPKLAQNLLSEISFFRQMKNQGFTPTAKILFIEKTQNVPLRIQMALGTADEYYHIKRVRFADDEAIMLDTAYLPVSFFPELEENLDQFELYIGSKAKSKITFPMLEIRPVIVNEFEKEHLGTDVNTLCLMLERMVYIDEQPVCFQKLIVRNDRCRFLLSNEEESWNIGFKIKES